VGGNVATDQSKEAEKKKGKPRTEGGKVATDCREAAEKKTRTRLAKDAGVGSRTAQKAITVLRNADDVAAE